MKQLFLAGCAVMLLGVAGAQAGPCNTGKDAGSGPTPGYTGQTTGSTASNQTEVKEHPPTATMNRATGSTAASDQDAQRQMQGKPTAAEQAMGAKPSTKTADQGC